MDLKELSKKASKPFRRIEELHTLPILYVLERAGVAYEDRGGVYTARNPFRPDNNPSFDIFGAKLGRWGDFAEGSNGDVLDLLQRFAPGRSFVEIKDWASRLLDEYLASGWSGPTEGGERKQFDLGRARDYVNGVLTSEDNDADMAVDNFLRERKDYLRTVPAEYLVDKFKLGWDHVSGRIIIPYIDRDGKLRWYKTRYLDGGVRAAAGYGYDTIFYGSHLDTEPFKVVVLCEGESDVWSGTHAAGQDFTFLGLPTGAGTVPNGLAETLIGRRVILAFDGDDAGRTATSKWYPYLDDLGIPVRDANIQCGFDLSTLFDIRSGLVSVADGW